MKTNENNPDWRLEGDYFDGRNCKSICPCIFALYPTEGDCKGLAAWHIEKGHFINGTNNDRNSNTNNENANNNSINLANQCRCISSCSRTYAYRAKVEDCSLPR